MDFEWWVSIRRFCKIPRCLFCFDDGIGIWRGSLIWRGSKRAFETFVRTLNKETNKYGINLAIAEIQYGTSINFLDVSFFIDESNLIQFKSYTKPTAQRFIYFSAIFSNDQHNWEKYLCWERNLRNGKINQRLRETTYRLLNEEPATIQGTEIMRGKTQSLFQFFILKTWIRWSKF